jgi:L-threonylcarbamoyladenylate synthase
MCKTERLAVDFVGVQRAAAILRGGGVVAFPTETVYGLAANALDGTAVAKIFAAKQRPGWDPLIVHVSDRTMLGVVASIPTEIAAQVEALIAAFWPGPLTMLLPRTAAIPDAVTAGRPLVGVRMPAHPVALDLIRQAGVPLAAPSANRFGHTSPTSAAHVLEDLDGRIDAVLDGGPAAVGIESTVLDVSATPMMIYRPGAITQKILREVTGCEVELFRADTQSEETPESLPSPGVGMRHYAPRARLELVTVAAAGRLEHSLHAAIEARAGGDELIGVMLPEGWDAGGADKVFAFGKWGDEGELAQRLFAGLRELDARGVSVIVCPVPVGDGVGAALRDRLEKAARAK